MKGHNTDTDIRAMSRKNASSISETAGMSPLLSIMTGKGRNIISRGHNSSTTLTGSSGSRINTGKISTGINMVSQLIMTSACLKSDGNGAAKTLALARTTSMPVTAGSSLSICRRYGSNGTAAIAAATRTGMKGDGKLPIRRIA